MKIDREELARATEAGGWEKYKTFAKLSGPGWLQSAITLGGGSLAGALFLGVIGGYGARSAAPSLVFLRGVRSL